jgi:uncharacterized membrane protein
MIKRRTDAGYSMIWWAVFIALIVAPLLVLSIEVGRYMHARGEIQKGADLAALAAAQEVDFPALRQTGQVRLTDNAATVAQDYVNRNTGYLAQQGIRAQVTSIRVINPAAGLGELPQVETTVQADLSRLFPAFLPPITVRVVGVAEVRAF